MRRLLATFKLALRAMWRNKMRTILTMLGMIIGVGAVIVVVGLGNGASAQVEAQIASLGRDVILIFSGGVNRGGVRSGWGNAGTLTLEDANAIKREIKSAVIVSPEQRTSAQISAGNQNWSTQILGESEEYLDLRQWPLSEGSMFTSQDVRGATKVAIVGATVARQLFGDASPVGQVIRIKNVPFVVLGVLVAKGLSVSGSDQDDIMILPYTSVMKRIQNTTTLRGINIQASSSEVLTEAQQEITELLRQRHRITPEREDDFTVRNQQEIADAQNATSKTMKLLLTAVAGVSLLVGGIGIMNIMMVSVTERTREIGIRMAVGAKGRDIMIQFLIEAMTLSVIGGGTGILLGVVGSQVTSSQLGWPVLIPLTAIGVAFVFSALVGIVFGLYPAWKASNLDPIDALRYE
jgi:putative ABC transport system permease protein